MRVKTYSKIMLMWLSESMRPRYFTMLGWSKVVKSSTSDWKNKNIIMTSANTKIKAKGIKDLPSVVGASFRQCTPSSSVWWQHIYLFRIQTLYVQSQMPPSQLSPLIAVLTRMVSNKKKKRTQRKMRTYFPKITDTWPCFRREMVLILSS